MMKKLLNLGCGRRLHPDWVNLDLRPMAPDVNQWDLRKPLPFPSSSFEVVYHSHVLEHFSRKQGHSFLKECYRVLRPGGTIRVVVPDLERIAELYLEALRRARNREPGWAENYEWMVIEMYDQAVRDEPCGAFAEYCCQDPIPNLDFVRQRWGAYADGAIRELRGLSVNHSLANSTAKVAWGYVARNPLRVARQKIINMSEALKKIMLGNSDWGALKVGRFRREGEIHMWMYDSYSLSELLQSVGFSDPKRVGAAESRVPKWADFHLDVEPDGRTYKADSLYIEALKANL